MRIIIAGGRDFNDYPLLKRKLDIILKNITDDIVIVCGMAEGADLLGKRYADEKGYTVDPYPADWSNLDVEPCIPRQRRDGSWFNLLAGPNRNKKMSENADALVAFHDGKSTGTANMIKLAEAKGLLVRTIYY